MSIKRLMQLLVAVVVLHSCGKKVATEDFNSDFSLFHEYILNFSSGLVSANSDIRVTLAFDKQEWQPNQEIDKSLFDISPSVKGKMVALASNTIAFVPEKALEQDTEYRIVFKLSKLIKTEKGLEEFKFSIKTLKQDFIVNVMDLQSYSRELNYLNGTIQTSDLLDFTTASKLVEATQDGKKLKIKFDKSLSTKTEFKFIIDSIQRKVEDDKIEISWNGKPFNIDQKGSVEYEIPGKNNFKIVGMEVGDEDNQSLLINFTDPIKKGQDLQGLVSVETAQTTKFLIEGNLLKVFFSEPLKGDLLVEVFQGITSDEGYKMKETHSQRVAFNEMKPNVRFSKNGSILPSSNNLKINFESANLKAVDVKVYKIYQNNVLQFLQDNNLNGNRNLRKVASPIAKQTINLLNKKLPNYSKWNTFALDLSKIITPEPGAIYRVEMSFKKSYSLFKCSESTTDSEYNREDVDEEVRSNDDDYYDYYWYDDYDWYDSKDACQDDYFRRGPIGMNVLASDLGVIAKRGENGSYTIAVTNIVNTQPISGATIELYDFQQQKIASGTSDAEGIASFEVSKYAYFALVSKDKQTTYVKLDEGYSQSVSNFDVSGEKLQKGLKGYIYGERGVWRPGDTLFLSFMLNDAASKLDKSHPIQFKLNDPTGKLTFQSMQKYNELNHYKFIIPTRDSHPTGSWEAVISVGGARFYKNIKIETIKPNRLKIKNKFDSEILSTSKINVSEVEVAWLHGAVAKDLKMEMQAKIMQQKTAFKGFANYNFDDPIRQFETEETTIYNGKVNSEGKATVSFQPKVSSQSPGMLKASLMTKVYENGGDFSTDVMATTLSPYQTYVGLKTPETNKYGLLETGKMNRYDIVTVDEKGNPKAVQNLKVQVYKVEWRWWWDASYDNLSSYVSSSSTTAFKNFNVSTNSTGKASVQFKNDENEWGRYLIRVTDEQGGHATGSTVMIDWPYWSGKTRNTDASNASMLMFSTDKKNYAVGEKAKISFPSSAGGRALISLENGSRVVKTFWANTQKGETKVEIPITGEMAPNVFVHITLLQPHASTLNDSPIRLYGIVPIEVIDKNTILEPQITMPEVLQPEGKTSIRVSEKSGKAMTYTLAIVDDGLLDLTRFKTPNAWNSFYTREALGVKTWDIFDEVIGAYGGRINQVFSIGGDEDLGGSKAKKANRFKPVVMYFGPYKLEKGKSQTHKITMPNYVGSVRTMVVAGDVNSSAYGAAEKTTPVRKPLMVLASLPRKISPTEKVTLPVTIFAMEPQVKNVSLQIKTNNGIRVIGKTSQSLSFAQPDEKMAYFELEVGELTGLAKVQVIATSGNEKATYEVELDITNPNPITNEFTDIVLEPNSSKTIEVATFGVAGSNKAQLEVSSFPTIDFSRRLQYLIQYPHGCLEQTTSSVFPQLYLADIFDLDQNRKNEIQKNIKIGIQKLGGFQISNGGFSYWSGQNYADDWSSSYVGHFLIEAEKKGYVLPINFKSKWIAYQQKASKEWRLNKGYHNDFAQAYRLYTLALAGSPDMASMNRLRETTGISNESKLRLAAAYALAGQKQAAQTLFNQSKIDETNQNHYYYYGSPERNKAMALETLLLTGNKQRAFKMAIDLAKNMASDQWMSTQTTAYCLYAMSKFAQQNGGKGVEVTYSLNGKSQTITTAKSLANRNLDIKNGSNSITIKNTKSNTLYVRVLTSGILPIGQEKAMQSKLYTNLVFKNRSGAQVNVSKIAQGTEFIAEITIRNQTNERVENLALTQIIPSGFEIVNTRFTDFGSFGNNVADHIDIRDDRTNFYFGLKANESRTFRVLLNASYLGNYYLPGMQAEAMYDNTYAARTLGQWVEVVKE
ncbi:alpha-2-macroglobulin family protein [Flavobacterium orientale]|uniref:Membrane protein n=1 Tax=Flavobacterium orientale TaxID=1756020 RepID=A0A916Y8D2_9FLAO|nr:MG2 domain-containing protein [Flavobacterium orientale]GGD34165.1 membrane protein [Flavobacterium orientale]